MKHRFKFLFIFVLLALGSLNIPASGTMIGNVELSYTDVVIQFNQPIDLEKIVPQSTVIYEYKTFDGVVASVPTLLIDVIRTLPFVKTVEIDYQMHLYQDTLDWGHDKINAERVWGSGEDAVDVVPGNYAGQGVKVAILDTGMEYTHEDLSDRYAGGYDFVNNDNDPIDDQGHGTHVAGIIAASDNGVGVIGVAPKADLYAVKVLDSEGSGSYSNIIAGIDWAVDNNMDVISMSLGGSGTDAAMETALNNAYAAGIVNVAASGNEYGFWGVSYPAAYDSVIAVGATDSSDTRASFSNYGPEMEVSAPGVDIYSTVMGNGYDVKSGTSMATPIVSGLVALMFSKDPSLTPDEVRQILHDTSLDLGSAGWDKYYGYGRVQADVALDAIGGGTPPDTTPPAKVTGLTASTVSQSQIDLTWNANTESDLDHYVIYRDGSYLTTTTATSYSDIGLTASTTYSYEVSAVDTSSNEGTKSDPASATTDNPPADTTPPAKVTGLTASTVSQSQIDLTWNANTESDLDHYVIYRDGSYLTTTTATSYSDTGLTASTTYSYEVSAVDTSSNEGIKSDPASATTDPEQTGTDSMHVYSIDMWFEKFTFWIWQWFDVYMKVTVHDQNGNVLAGVTVSMEMDTPDGLATGSADTGTDGTVTFMYDNGPSGTYTGRVTDMVKTGYVYDSAANVETEETIQVS